MRLIAFVAAVALISPADGASQAPNWPNPGPSGLQMGHAPAEQCFAMYAPPPTLGADCVFFQGERNAFRVQVGNMGPAETTLVVGSVDPLQMFQVNGLRAPTLSVSCSSPQKVWPSGRFDVRLERETVLDVGEFLEWVMTLPTDLEPGVYRVEVRINGTQRGQPLSGYAAPQFEVRARSAEALPEILRREAFRRFYQNDFAGARETAAQLLRIHPSSTQAHIVLVWIAEREWNHKEAARHKARIEAIAKSGGDTLWLKYGKGGYLE